MKLKSLLASVCLVAALCNAYAQGEDPVKAYCDSASTCLQNFQFGEAIDYFEIAYQLDEDNGNNNIAVAANLAILLFEQCRYDEALKYLQLVALSEDVDQQGWAASMQDNVRSIQGFVPYQVDMDAIEERLKADESEYSELKSRFLAGDFSLNFEDVALLYYGSACMGLRTDDSDVASINELIEQGMTAEAYSAGIRMVENNCPFSISLTYNMYKQALMEEDENYAETLRKRLTMLYGTLTATGVGFTADVPTWVMAISDVDGLLDIMGNTGIYARIPYVSEDDNEMERVLFYAGEGPKQRFFCEELAYRYQNSNE